MWRDFSLGDHIGVLSGFAFSSAHFSSDGSGLPLIRIRDIGSASTEIGYSGLYEQRYVVNRGEILIGMDGEFLVRKWAGEPGLLNQRVLKLFARPGSELDIDFTYYWLGPYLKSVEDKTPETTVKHLSVRTVEAARVRAPDLPHQRKIAAVLSALDTQIAQTEALIAKQEQVRAGLMQDLFTRGVDKSGRLRPPREEAPELYHETKLGWLPKDWRTAKVGDYITKIDSGWSPNCDSDPVQDEQWGVLKTTAVVWAGYIPTENKRLPSDLSPLTSAETKAGDILITRKGPVERVGVAVFVEQTPPRLMFPDTVFRTRLVHTEELTGAFMVASMQSEVVQKHWWQRKIGLADAQVNINHGIVRSTLFHMPPTSEQASMLMIKSASEQALAKQQIELAYLSSIRAGLMQDLLTGKVPIDALLKERAAA